MSKTLKRLLALQKIRPDEAVELARADFEASLKPRAILKDSNKDSEKGNND